MSNIISFPTPPQRLNRNPTSQQIEDYSMAVRDILTRFGEGNGEGH